jgi:hypothetical protein
MLIDLEEIRSADVVIGVDLKTGDETVFYGLSLLRLIAQGLEPEVLGLKVLRVPIDWDTDEPKQLAAACVAVKGSHDAASE